MPRRPNLKPKRNKQGEWFIDLPPRYSSTGKRQRRYFPSEARAQIESRGIEIHVKKHGVDSTRFAASESSDAKAAIKMLKSLNLKGDYELTLKAAVKHYSEHLIGLEKARTVSEALRASVDYRTRRTGKSWSHGHKRELNSIMYGPLPKPRAKEDERIKERGFLVHFGDRNVDSITEEEISNFLEKHHRASEYQYNQALRHISPIFSHAHKRGWITLNPTAFIPKKNIRAETEVLTIKEFRRAAELIQTDEYRNIAAGISILMFAGIRPTELMGNEDKPPLLWESVILNPQGVHTKPYIDIPEANAKGVDGRQVQMEPNLVKWLEGVPNEKRKGAIFPKAKYHYKYSKFREALGVTGKKDIFRHSFGTYYFHHFESLEKTMSQMGHTSRSTFEKHYKRYNPEEDSAFLYWQIAPEGATVPEVGHFAVL